MKNIIYDTEHVLPDDYPIHTGFLYLCNGNPFQSNLSTTVKGLKARWQSDVELEIRKCDISKRNLWDFAL